MAAPLWNSYAVRPFGIAGAGNFVGWAVPASVAPADEVLELKALVSLAPVTGHDDPTATAVPVPVSHNGSAYAQGFPGEACLVSWFARTGSGWNAGPVVPANFEAAWSAKFSYLKTWAATTLQRLEREGLPLGENGKVHVRTSYPRDTFPLPCLSVQFEAAPQVQTVLGNFAAAPAAQISQERVPWSMSLSVVLWCDTPELRDEITPWFLQAMTALGSLSPMVGLAEPSYQFNESEDFSGALMEKPLFVVTCNLSGTVWSELKIPSHNYQGHLTI